MTSTCSMCRRYSGRIRKNSTSAPDQRTDHHADEHASRERPPAQAGQIRRGHPRRVGAGREEGAVREVQHVHQPVDQRKSRSHQEVQRAETDAGDQDQDQRTHDPTFPGSRASSAGGRLAVRLPPASMVRSASLAHSRGPDHLSGVARTGRSGQRRRDPEQRIDQRLVRQQRRGVGRVHHPAGVDAPSPYRRSAGPAAGSARPAARWSARRPGPARRRPRSTSLGARPLVGSSTSSSLAGPSSTLASATICCWPPDSVPARCFRRSAAPGTVRAPCRSPVDRRALRPAPGSPRPSARRTRPGPRARTRRRSGRSGGWADRSISIAVELDLDRCDGTSPRIALRVVVLPTPLRPSSAVTPPSAHGEVDALQDV